MRRTGSEDIGLQTKTLDWPGNPSWKTSRVLLLRSLLFLVHVLVRIPSGGLGSRNTMPPGALCPASSSVFAFISGDYPQIVPGIRLRIPCTWPKPEIMSGARHECQGPARQN